MPGADQLADSIIKDEGLDKSPEDKENKDDQDSQDQGGSDDSDQKDDLQEEDKGEKDDQEESGDDQDESDSKDEKEESEEAEEDYKPSEIVEKGKGFLAGLQAEGLNPYDSQGNVRKFEEVVPSGQYLAAALQPVKVIDKDGKTHEFLLLSDVEKKFPDGFEAKNNIAQMKFERAIMNNENSFDKAIADYKQLEQKYQEEISQLQESQASQQDIAKQYRAMAEDGLVPKVGNPSDPNFKNSDAVRELDSLLIYMNEKNQELQKKGLGKIDSLYVAKQLMDTENGASSKKDKAKDIDQQRKKVASLTKSPQSKDTHKPKQTPRYGTTAQLAEQIIAEEGLN